MQILENGNYCRLLSVLCSLYNKSAVYTLGQTVYPSQPTHYSVSLNDSLILQPCTATVDVFVEVAANPTECDGDTGFLKFTYFVSSLGD